MQVVFMTILVNPWRGLGLDIPELEDIPAPSTDATRVRALLTRCPVHERTPLTHAPALHPGLWLKDERNRMGLGSFKALGAAYVIACDAEEGQAEGRTYVTASAGNHGLSVAAGAAAFGAKAQVYIARNVPEAFAERLREIGAEVIRAGNDYEQSMQAAGSAAAAGAGLLLSDSSWPGYTARPHRLMEGYLALMAEAIEQLPEAPDGVFLQAGVGGFAGAMAALVRQTWGDAPKIAVVEPAFAPALQSSIAEGKPVMARGPASSMGRLDCKEPSLIALKGLARDADYFITLTEDEAAAATRAMTDAGFATTPSGAAGYAGIVASRLPPEAKLLAFLTEGPE